MRVTIDCTTLTLAELLPYLENMKNMTILAPCPLVKDKRTVVEYFLHQPKLANVLKVAKTNNIKLIFDLPLAGLGTKTSQNKKTIQKLIGKQATKMQLKSLPNERKKRLSKSNFEKIPNNRLLGIKLSKKIPSSTARLLCLEDETVIETHKEVIKYISELGITLVSIPDVTDEYLKKISTDDQTLKFCRCSYFNSTSLSVKNGKSIGFCFNGENMDLLLWVVSNKRQVELEYSNDNTKINIFVGYVSGFIITNNHETNYHKIKKDWPKRKLPIADGAYYLVGENPVELVVKDGDFMSTIKSNVKTSQIFVQKQN